MFDDLIKKKWKIKCDMCGKEVLSDIDPKGQVLVCLDCWTQIMDRVNEAIK